MFAALQGHARGLHQVVSKFPIGAATPVDFPEDLPAAAEPKRYENWLQSQIAAYDTAITAEQLKLEQAASAQKEDNAEVQDALLDQMDAIKSELREVAAERGRELDLITRMRHTAIVTKAMFPDDAAEYEFTLDADVASRLSERVLARDALVVKFLKCKQEVANMEATLLELRANNQQLQGENREAMGQLKELRSAVTNDQSAASSVDETSQRQSEQALKRYTDQYKIICNVFQSLIVASGIDWSTDDGMKETMTDLSRAPPS